MKTIEILDYGTPVEIPQNRNATVIGFQMSYSTVVYHCMWLDGKTMRTEWIQSDDVKCGMYPYLHQTIKKGWCFEEGEENDK